MTDPTAHDALNAEHLWARRNRRRLATGALLAAALVAGLGGWRTWQAHLDQHREASADQRLSRLENQLSRLILTGDWERIEARFATFAQRKEHRGTSALAQAWHQHGLRRLEHGRPDALAALINAWLIAPDSQREVEAGVSLATELLEQQRFDAAVRISDQLPADAAPLLADIRGPADLARRDFSRTQDPMALALSTGRRLNRSISSASLLDVDGDASPELLTTSAMGQGVVTLASPWDPADPGRELRTPLEPGQTQGFASHQGDLYLNARDGLYVSKRGESPFVKLASLPTSSYRSSIAVHDWGDGPLALVGRSYPERGLYGVWLETGEVFDAHPATTAIHSETTGMWLMDLDEDDVPEVVMGLDAWNAYDVRVFSMDDGTPTLRGRRFVGGPGQLAVVRSPTGPLIASATFQEYANARVFGTRQPFGPPPRLVLLAQREGQLDVVRELEPPVRFDDNRGKRFNRLFSGDFDGNGMDDVAIGIRDSSQAGSPFSLWVVADAAGPAPRSLYLRGIEPMAVLDQDRDGDVELLVSDEQGVVRWLGTTGETLPVLAAPTLAVPLPPMPDTEDESVRRVWSRAAVLLEAGLVPEAAEAIADAFRLSSDTGLQVLGLSTAARLHASEQDWTASASRWLEALALAPEQQTLREGAVEALVQDLRLDEAASVATGLPATSSWSWVQESAMAVEVLGEGTLDPRWELDHPETLAWNGSAWALELANDQPGSMRLPVRYAGGRLAVRIEGSFTKAELGSGLQLALTQQDQRRLSLEWMAQGGGGLVVLRTLCRGKMLELAPQPQRAHAHPFLGLLALAPQMGRGCGNREVRSWKEEEPLPPGDYTLELRRMGDPTYEPPLFLRSELTSLSLVGLTPTGEPHPSQDLLPGRFTGSLDGLDPDDAIFVAARRGEVDRVRALARQVPRAQLLRALRLEPTVLAPVVAELPNAAALFAQAWSEPLSQYPWRADLQLVAQLPELDQVPLDTPEAVRLWVGRAHALAELGHTDQARRAAERVVQAAPPGSGRLADPMPGALLLLARLEQDTDPAQARQWLQQAIAHVASPDLFRHRLSDEPGLMALLDD